MNIRIGDFSITSDDRNIVLNEIKIREKSEKEELIGTEYTVPIAYCSSVEHAMEYLLKYKLRKSDATTLAQLMDEVRGIKRMIRDALEGV